MLSPAPFCFFHALYSISFVQLAAVFQPLLLLSPVYRKNPALTRKMFRFLFCRRKYGILIIQILSCYQLNQIALRSIMEPFNTPLKIREISLPHRAVFGPMAGFTDAPARRLMAQHGAGFTVSEMVSSRALVYGDHKTVSLLKAEPNGAPYGVQIFGEVPEIMGQAAAAVEQYAFDFLDINMGCPAPKIVSGGAGSKLMLDPDRCGRITGQ